MEASSRNGSGGVNGSNGMSRAERFDDEKKRIIESCFARPDADGVFLESYITHIRIIEDSAYPSSPPPPNANPDVKKPRLIIVAVRKSGRVRMHKARENANGTFSIGKTWPLDDLSAVESFSGAVPSNPEDEQRKLWAGGTGFIVTIGKPYYWQANTQKEKQFFIASLVKIYTKYTGGKSPELIGFDSRERDTLLGIQARQSPAGGPPYGQSPIQSRPPRRDPSREVPLRKQQSRDAMQRLPPPSLSPGGTSSLTSQTSRPQMRPRRDDSPARSVDPNGMAPPQNPPPLRRLAGSNQSQESFSRSDDSVNLPPPPRSRGGTNGLPSAPGRFQERNITPTSSQRVNTPDSSFSSIKDVVNDVPSIPAPLSIPPERRRPPMPLLGDSARGRRGASNDNVTPAPLVSPAMRREDIRPPTRGSERVQPSEPVPDITGNNSPTTDLYTPKEISQPPPETSIVTSTPILDENIPTVETPLTPATSPPVPNSPEEEDRPGLGPMIRKRSKGDIASTFLRAAKSANAFNSFKPRAGGAAERLREMQAKLPDGPDGITSVVPAPSLVRGMSSDDSIVPSSATTPTIAVEPPQKSSWRKVNPEAIPEVKITLPPSDLPKSPESPVQTLQDTTLQGASKPREARRPKPASEVMQKELASLGINPSILGGRGNELVNAWDEFGWVGDGVHTKSIDQLKEDVERELNKVQAGGWLSRLEEEDERVEAIKQGLDKCMDECDELDGLLTLYLVELGMLNEDIAFIEAQSQGLQVQTANQKLLQTELQSLLDTISISSSQLESLREASLETPRGLEQIERSLVVLFKAMVTIDPSLGSSGPRASEDGSVRSGRPGGIGDSEIGSMRVLQEKKDVYRNESVVFLRRLKPFLQVKFAAAIDETRKALESEKGTNLARVAGKAKLDSRNHDLSRAVLWRYSALMLFAREVNRSEWEDLMKTYEMICKPLYQDEFRDAVFAWKRIARKPTGDEADVLFTSQIEKQTDNIATTARKLTVKRSQTLAKSLRSPMGENSSKLSLEKASDGRLQQFEVFAGALDEMVPIISMEQNFLVEFFHVSSLEQYDFPDVVAATPPESRRGGDLRRPKVMDPNRELARQVFQVMEDIYSFFPGDMQALVDWSLQHDPLQGVGVLAAIERKLVDLEESSQEFLTRTLQKVHTRLLGLFTKFVEDQIRAIEETKVKIKKRKGVIGFIRIFPSFSLSLETMLISAADLDIRHTVNKAYVRVNKAMFESLKVIARENPAAQTAGADPEDKEALNYQILLIENMYHYLEEVETRANPVLEEWKENAAQEMQEHMSLYIGAVIRRPLGKLLDFLENTENAMLARQAGQPASSISVMPSHSKSLFKKILAGYDAKEIKKGIETLKKRVEKHFGDADDPGLSRSLVLKVHQNCEKFYEKIENRILTLSRDVYDGDVVAEWTPTDRSSAFKR